jgi:hypothetical protein
MMEYKDFKFKHAIETLQTAQANIAYMIPPNLLGTVFLVPVYQPCNSQKGTSVKSRVRRVGPPFDVGELLIPSTSVGFVDRSI